MAAEEPNLCTVKLDCTDSTHTFKAGHKSSRAQFRVLTQGLPLAREPHNCSCRESDTRGAVHKARHPEIGGRDVTL